MIAYLFYVGIGIALGVVAVRMTREYVGDPVVFLCGGVIAYVAALFAHIRFAHGIPAWPAFERANIYRTIGWAVVLVVVGRFLEMMVHGAWLRILRGYDDSFHLNPALSLSFGSRYFGRTTAAAVGLFNACFIAPIVEEVLCRSGLYRILKGRFSVTVAAGGSALLFALMHRSVSAFPSLFVVGILCCWIYEQTGDIRGPILFHAGGNLLAWLGALGVAG
ncbi:MAG: CPBP family intramembrane metalloprotease [Opitutaceae bacterium]